MKADHEIVFPNEGLPFRLFRFEGKDGNYFRDRHWHQSVEIFAVFEGELVFHKEENKKEENYFLREGDFVIVNPNEIHWIDSPVPNYTMVLQIPLMMFQEHLRNGQFIQFTHNRQEKDKEMMGIICKMQICYEEKKYGYIMQMKSLFYSLMYELVSEYQELSVTQDMLNQNKRMNRLSEITAYMRENYKTELSLEILAEVFGYTPAYLSRMFQKYAGINFKSYLQNIRVEKAYRELENTEHEIGDIALEHGFPNGKALSRAFKSKYGMLPSEFRKNLKKPKN